MTRIKSSLKFVILVLAVFLISFFLWLFVDGRLRFNTPSHEEYPVRGIDVSHHQGVIDWEKVKVAGYDFVFMKATEGGDFRDTRFVKNWEEAGRAGMARGAYHFFTLCRKGADQARNFIQVVPQGGELPPVVDLEFGGNCSARPEDEVLMAELSDFLDRVGAQYGRAPVLYMTYEFLNEYMKEGFPDNEIWIRDIFFHPRLPKARKWVFWQHHNRGRVDGIDGPVDLNVFNGDENRFQSYVE